MMAGDLEGGLLGLADLLGDAGIFGLEVGVVLGRGADAGGVLLILAGVGSDVGEDTQLGDVRVVLRTEALELGVEGFVARAGQTGVALVDLDIRIAFTEAGSPGKGFRFNSTYLRYVLS